MGYVITEDKGKYQIAQDKFFTWKREGNVLTMQKFLQPSAPCNYENLYANGKYQRHVLLTLPKLKAIGIDIVEFWVFKVGIEVTKAYFEKVGLKFEVVREEEAVFLCRLLL